MYDTSPRGSFTRDQIQQLLKAVAPSRIVKGSHVKPHLSQQDVLAHLSRVFGFGHFDIEVISSECLYEVATENSNKKAAWSVGYRAQVRLYVRDEQQRLVTILDGGSTGESEGQPSRASSHDLAYKSALSTAMKRAAIALGDQFGLSLYNKGQETPLVKGTMIGLTHDGSDVQQGVEQQVADGGRESEREDGDEPAPEPEQPKRRTSRAKTGTQGTRRKTADEAAEPDVEPPAAEPKAAEPEPEPEAAPADGDGPSAAERIATVEHADLPAQPEPKPKPESEPTEPEPLEPEYDVAPNGEIIYRDPEPWSEPAAIDDGVPEYDPAWPFGERAKWLEQYGTDNEMGRQLWLDWQNAPGVDFTQEDKTQLLAVKAKMEQRAADKRPAALA